MLGMRSCDVGKEGKGEGGRRKWMMQGSEIEAWGGLERGKQGEDDEEAEGNGRKGLRFYGGVLGTFNSMID